METSDIPAIEISPLEGGDVVILASDMDTSSSDADGTHNTGMEMETD